MYMNGEGVPANPAAAVNLFKQGAEKGDPSGMFDYAVTLWDGTGVRKDRKAATDWFKRAAQAGDRRAIEWCNQNKVPFK
jgi:TPR repeat protein